MPPPSNSLCKTRQCLKGTSNTLLQRGDSRLSGQQFIGQPRGVGFLPASSDHEGSGTEGVSEEYATLLEEIKVPAQNE